jgi:hypothetical protein
MPSGTRTDPASLIDIEPTLLHWAGLEWGANEFDGLDLFQNRHALVYSQLSSGDSGLYMAASDHDKLIYSRADDKFYYFDAFSEKKNRYDPSSSACRILRGLLENYIAADCSAQSTCDVDKELEEARLQPFKPFRQDHVARHAEEADMMPQGYAIEL